MVINCEIKFGQNAHGIYYSGQVVSGKVHLTLSKTKSVKGVYLQINGFAKVHWNEHHAHGHRKYRWTEDNNFNAREDYMSTISYLVGSEDADPMDLNPGAYTYNFSCALPTTAPSSFEGTMGTIRYVAKVVLIRPGKNNETFTVGFTVIKPLDLNYDSPIIKLPVQAETAKKFFWCLCWSKPLSMSINIPQTGFVPGQYIPVTVSVVNDSFINVHAVHFYLRKIVSYYCTNPTEKSKTETFIVFKKSTGKVEKYSSRIVEENLHVPAVPPSSASACKIIKISYDVHVEAEVGGFKVSPNISCPITIGTIPLVDVVRHQPRLSIANRRLSQYGPVPVLAPIENAEPFVLPDYLDPPSYHEATHMEKVMLDEDGEDSLGSPKFMPRYPVFKYEPPSAPLPQFEMGYANPYGEGASRIPQTEL